MNQSPNEVSAPASKRHVLEVDTQLGVQDLIDQSRGVDCVRIRVSDFADGRVFSQVRALTEDCGYQGEIEVQGDLLPEQASLLSRYGIDKVALTNGLDINDQPNFITAHYQKYKTSGLTSSTSGEWK